LRISVCRLSGGAFDGRYDSNGSRPVGHAKKLNTRSQSEAVIGEIGFSDSFLASSVS